MSTRPIIGTIRPRITIRDQRPRISIIVIIVLTEKGQSDKTTTARLTRMLGRNLIFGLAPQLSMIRQAEIISVRAC